MLKIISVYLHEIILYYYNNNINNNTSKFGGYINLNNVLREIFILSN